MGGLALAGRRARAVDDAVPVAAAGVALGDEAAGVVVEFVEELVAEGVLEVGRPEAVRAAVGPDEAVEEGEGGCVVVVCVGVMSVLGMMRNNRRKGGRLGGMIGVRQG